MTGPGYDLQVPWSVRITNSGEFIHAASWNGATSGSAARRTAVPTSPRPTNTQHLEEALDRTRTELMQLLRSAAYTSAVERANDAKRLRTEANAAKRRAEKAAAHLRRTRAELEAAKSGQEKADEDEVTG
jgi:hypothetical protein